MLPDRCVRDQRVGSRFGGGRFRTAGVCLVLRNARRALRQELDQVLGEEQVEGPVERHPELFLEARQLAEVDGPPQPPGDESRELEAEDFRDPGAAADRRQLAEPAEIERLLASAVERGDDVPRRDRTLPSLTEVTLTLVRISMPRSLSFL